MDVCICSCIPQSCTWCLTPFNSSPAVAGAPRRAEWQPGAALSRLWMSDASRTALFKFAICSYLSTPTHSPATRRPAQFTLPRSQAGGSPDPSAGTTLLGKATKVERHGIGKWGGALHSANSVISSGRPTISICISFCVNYPGLELVENNHKAVVLGFFLIQECLLRSNLSERSK